MKNFIKVFLMGCILVLTACDSTTQGSNSLKSDSSSSSNSQDHSSSTPIDPVVNLPENLDDLNDLLTKASQTTYQTLEWEDNSDNTSGTVVFYQNEVLEEGQKKDVDGTISYLQYHGFDDNFYYELDTLYYPTAKKYQLTEEQEYDSYTQKTKEEAQSLVHKITHDCADWFINKSKETYTLSYLVEDKIEFFAQRNDDTYTVVVESVTETGYRTYRSSYEFDFENNFISGEFLSQQWSEDNFDSEKHEVIDPSLTPVSSNHRKVNVQAGPLQENPSLSIDKSQYFISSLDEVYVSSYFDSEEHKNECTVGSMITLYIESFAPTTALDVDSYNIVSSSNPNVIGKKSDTSSFYYALSEGQSDLTISDPFGTTSKIITVQVSYADLESMNVYCSDTQLYVGDSTEISVSPYPSSAKLDYTISCEEDTLIDYTTSEDLSTITVNAKSKGTATIVLTSVENPSITASVILEIIEKPTDLSWLIGTWKFDDGDFDCTVIFNDDFTGSIQQEVSGIAYPNEASFEYTYDGTTLSITKWEEDDYGTIRKPSSITVNDEKNVITLVAQSMDADEFYVNLTMTLEKEQPAIDVNWLIGTWVDEDEGFTFTFNNDFTGTLQSGPYSSSSFTWNYDGTTLSFDEWTDNYIYKPEAGDITIDDSKTKITMELEDDYEYYTANLVKEN